MPSIPAEPAPDPDLTRAFASCLPGGRLAGPLRAYRSVPSTQALARAAAEAGAPEGTVILADHQTAGRGRRGRRWTAPAGASLLFSVVLRPPLPVARWGEIPLAAGCAVAEALEAVAGVRAALKWPNDVLVEGGKVAGILAEGIVGPRPLVVLGIGVNVSQGDADWPPELARHARSLAGVAGPVAREHVLAAVLARLDAWYGVLLRAGLGPVRAAWRRRGVPGAPLPAADPGAGGDVEPEGLLPGAEDRRPVPPAAPEAPRREPASAGAG
jgi:BirA family biotin operon repressor/biotin-[acetyl-CoA-carboxylase] ligase